MKYTVVLFLFWQCASAQQMTDVQIDVRSLITEPNYMVVTKAKEAVVIDGVIDPAWEVAQRTSEFIDIEGDKTVNYKTSAKLLWDDAYLYVLAELEEPHIWGDLTKRDTIIYLNNDFEVFIDPSGKGESYGEIEINALNTVWDLLLNKPYRSGGFANFHWNLDGLKSAIKIEGTINNPDDIDKKWTVEMAIPMRPLLELKNDGRKRIKEGDQWRLNFSRVEWDHDIIDGKYRRKRVNGSLQREYNWVWSNQKKVNMHQPEMWGVIQFTEQHSAENVQYNEDPDMLLKQVLYALYRETNRGELKSLRTSNCREVGIRARYASDQFYDAVFVKTGAGYEISIQSENTNQLFVINEKGERKAQPLEVPERFVFSTWAHGDQVMDTLKWQKKLQYYSDLGISEVLVSGSPHFLSELVKLSAPRGIAIHAWMWTLNRPNDTIANKHPEWYAVNRKGQNSLDYRAYVDYYQWLSPFHPEAREYIKSNVRKLVEIDGLASIHLDYVRYVDVILGADLQPKYGLVQTEELPEYDYGYHPIALKEFERLFGKNPKTMEHPELSTEWRQFRLNAITSLVNAIAEEVHNDDKKLSAAVFPFPEMSRQMVRQAWNDWNLDRAYPMIYHNFYRENINWIGFATEQGVSDVNFPIHTGLYLPAFSSSQEFEQAIRIAKQKGATGVSIFTADTLEEDYQRVLQKLHKGF